MPAKIRLFPDPILRKSSERIRRFGAPIRPLVRTLLETLVAQPSGIGIAAPQIGISERIAIVDVSARVPEAKRLILINPEILERRDEKISREGCMSIPDYTAHLKRYDRILVRWQDEEGRGRQKVCRGIEAVCIQHEVDHLDGVLFLDRVSSLRTDMFPRSMKRR